KNTNNEADPLDGGVEQEAALGQRTHALALLLVNHRGVEPPGQIGKDRKLLLRLAPAADDKNATLLPRGMGALADRGIFVEQTIKRLTAACPHQCDSSQFGMSGFSWLATRTSTTTTPCAPTPLQAPGRPLPRGRRPGQPAHAVPHRERYLDQ